MSNAAIGKKRPLEPSNFVVAGLAEPCYTAQLVPRFSHLIIPSLLSLLGCTGTVTVLGDEYDPTAKCEFDSPAPAPEIQSPTAGLFVAAGLGPDIRLSGAAGAEDAVNATQTEVWLMAADQPVALVWSSSTSGTSPTTDLNLSAGTFKVGFEDGLDEWKHYAVRARRRTGGALCTFGDWSGYQPFRTDDGSEFFFDDSVIRDLEIEISPESFAAIDAEAVPPECAPHHRTYQLGTVIIDGETFDNAGVRAKGGCGSSRNLDDKASFKINLSDYSAGGECADTRRIRGLKRLTVNNQVQDGSAVHERLAYHLYDLVGVPVPRRAHIRVHVNGELWGLYLHLESIDRRFLERRWTGIAAEGALYEGTYRCDIVSQDMPAVDGPETCWGKKFSSTCSTPEPGGDPFNYAPLISFSDRIAALPDGGFYPAIRDFVDFDAYLSHWAADTIMNHWDGAIFDILNNFRVYHDPRDDRWVMIPTGLDQSWNEGQRPINPWQPDNIIARRCLQETACEAAFAARLKEVLAIFENEDFAALANTIRDQIRSDVAADPRKEVNDAQFESRVDATIAFINGRPGRINTWLNQRGY